MRKIAVLLLSALLLSATTACTGVEGEALSGRMGESLSAYTSESLRARGSQGYTSVSVGAQDDTAGSMSGVYTDIYDSAVSISFTGGSVTVTDTDYGESVRGSYTVASESVEGMRVNVIVCIFGSSRSFSLAELTEMSAYDIPDDILVLVEMEGVLMAANRFKGDDMYISSGDTFTR